MANTRGIVHCFPIYDNMLYESKTTWTKTHSILSAIKNCDLETYTYHSRPHVKVQNTSKKGKLREFETPSSILNHPTSPPPPPPPPPSRELGYPTKNIIEDLTSSVRISQEMLRSSYI